MDIARYREELAERIVGLICEANGGKVPSAVEEWEACFGRFGSRVRWLPADVLPQPMIRGSVVLVPDVRPAGRQLTRWLSHELAEVVLAWEGTRAYQGPGWTTDRHRIANLVERELAAAPSHGVIRGEVAVV